MADDLDQKALELAWEAWEADTSADPLTPAIRAYLKALRSAGYAVVPVEPTQEMTTAGWNAIINLRLDGPDGTGPLEAKEIYRAMLTASGED